MSTFISSEAMTKLGESFFQALSRIEAIKMNKIPEDLAAIEHEVIFGSYGGFKIENGKLIWYNGWLGDAPGDDPMDTTYDACCEAQDIVVNLGYRIGESQTEHDYASFEIEIV